MNAEIWRAEVGTLKTGAVAVSLYGKAGAKWTPEDFDEAIASLGSLFDGYVLNGATFVVRDETNHDQVRGELRAAGFTAY